VEKTHVFHKFV